LTDLTDNIPSLPKRTHLLAQDGFVQNVIYKRDALIVPSYWTIHNLNERYNKGMSDLISQVSEHLAFL
jgi:hypothetical protein